eukprot:3941349-Rhodomonas_salina.2
MSATWMGLEGSAWFAARSRWRSTSTAPMCTCISQCQRQTGCGGSTGADHVLEVLGNFLPLRREQLAVSASLRERREGGRVHIPRDSSRSTASSAFSSCLLQLRTLAGGATA